MKRKDKPKIIFFVTEDWYFWSHRLPIARAAKLEGFDVAVVTRVDKHRALIENEGIRVLPIDLKRQGKSIAQEINSFIQIVKIYRQEKPELVHHVAMKPILYGTLAAAFAKIPHVVNAYAGLGFLFITRKKKARVLRQLLLAIYKALFLIKPVYTIFQTPEDYKFFVKRRIIKEERTVLIRGSGVNLSEFAPTFEPKGVVTIILASRMLWDKGIGELVEATKLLKLKALDFRTILVGKPDNENPMSIPEHVLKRWHEKGIIEWLGYRGDIPEVLSKAHIVVLPSYREGVPKGLLEAASCGKPIVTTDVVGCREVVKHQVNGYLVPMKNIKLLAQALEFMINNPQAREKMGAEGRKIVEKYFSEEVVIKKTVGLYHKILNN